MVDEINMPMAKRMLLLSRPLRSRSIGAPSSQCFPRPAGRPASHHSPFRGASQSVTGVSLISIRIGPTTDPKLVTRPDRGCTANPMAGGPPSRSATIKGRVGAGARKTKFAALPVNPPKTLKIRS
jgi:hypothetical protein